QVIAWLPLIAKADVPLGAYELKVIAKGNVAGKEISKYASVADVVKANMANLAFPPHEMLNSIAAGVTDKPLFTLTPKAAAREGTPAVAANGGLPAGGGVGFVEHSRLAGGGAPANVTVAVKPIGKGTNDIQVQLTAAAPAATGPFKLYLRGTAKSGGKDF